MITFVGVLHAIRVVPPIFFQIKPSPSRRESAKENTPKPYPSRKYCAKENTSKPSPKKVVLRARQKELVKQIVTS